MRKTARVDDNQRVIVAALRDAGAFVQTLHQVGGGCPDLLISFRDAWFVFEVKDGDKSASRQRLTPDEELWHQQARARVYVVTDIDEALAAIGAI